MISARSSATYMERTPWVGLSPLGRRTFRLSWTPLEGDVFLSEWCYFMKPDGDRTALNVHEPRSGSVAGHDAREVNMEKQYGVALAQRGKEWRDIVFVRLCNDARIEVIFGDEETARAEAIAQASKNRDVLGWLVFELAPERAR